MNRSADSRGGGQVPGPSPDSAARERIVGVLARAFANDQISETELEARIDRVYRATTEAELDAILADLPAPAPAVAQKSVPAEPPAARRISALLSGQEHRMTGVVPPDLRVRARIGYVELDLTDATFAPGVTTIDVRALFGYVQIRFPAGVRVESHGRALFGIFALQGIPAPSADAPVVRIVGRATFGITEGIIGS